MLCDVCVGVGYGCCVVCVCKCGIWVLCDVYVIVWGMGVVWCVPQYKLVGYVYVCMYW